MEYKLLAADMDGTALNKNKELGRATVLSMEKALAQGKHVLFSTGRGISFVRPYIEQVRGMRYAVSASGAEVLDLESGERILKSSIDAETVKHILAAATGYYCLPVIYMNGESYGTAWTVDNVADFGLEAFEPIYRSRMILCEDAFSYFMEHPQPVEKLNLFYAEEGAVDEILPRIRELPISFTSLTSRSMEINAVGVSKARGLEALCDRLGISLSECICVGDAQNDMEMLRAAGLAAAMGNASPEVKRICTVQAPDCDNDGVSAIIEQYLLA